MISKELQIWRAGEYLVLSDLLQNWIQCYDTAQGVEYDIIADIKWNLVRIQVKTTSKTVLRWGNKKPVYFFHTKRAGKGWSRFYSDNAFDYFALVCLEDKKVMYMKHNKGFSSISIRPRESWFDRKNYWVCKKSVFDDEFTIQNMLNDF